MEIVAWGILLLCACERLHTVSLAGIQGSAVAPTTVAPTTVAITTVAQTTDAPTTDAPTTVAITTDAPTTVAPTTVAITTDASALPVTPTDDENPRLVDWLTRYGYLPPTDTSTGQLQAWTAVLTRLFEPCKVRRPPGHWSG
ncbi:hypothetical protein DPEC_G00373220, partial [Dallia pectoralis]